MVHELTVRADSPSEPPRTLLVGAQGTQEVDLPERRPVRVAEVELAVGALPGQEAAQPDLAAGADDEVGICLAAGVEVAGDLVVGDRLGETLDRHAPGEQLADGGPAGVHQLLVAAVGQGECHHRPAAVGGGGLRRLDRRRRRSGRASLPADHPDAHGRGRTRRARGQAAQPLGDDVEQRVNLLRRPLEVLHREGPQRDLTDPERTAPADHLEDLVRAPPVPGARIREPLADRPPSVAVHDHRDMLRKGARQHLPRRRRA